MGRFRDCCCGSVWFSVMRAGGSLRDPLAGSDLGGSGLLLRVGVVLSDARRGVIAGSGLGGSRLLLRVGVVLSDARRGHCGIRLGRFGTVAAGRSGSQVYAQAVHCGITLGTFENLGFGMEQPWRERSAPAPWDWLGGLSRICRWGAACSIPNPRFSLSLFLWLGRCGAIRLARRPCFGERCAGAD